MVGPPRYFVHFSAADLEEARARAGEHGEVVHVETEPAPDGLRLYGSAEIVPHREPAE